MLLNMQITYADGSVEHLHIEEGYHHTVGRGKCVTEISVTNKGDKDVTFRLTGGFQMASQMGDGIVVYSGGNCIVVAPVLKDRD